MLGRSNITNLLTAPKFSQNEQEIVEVVSNHIGENITLKYSTSQGYSSPVQYIDIDGDETEEAVVFYYAPNKGANIRMAILFSTENGWQIYSDREGLGSEVFFFSAVNFEGLENKQLIVGYNTAHIDENFFAAYITDENSGISDYAESCQDIIVGDVTYDGYDEVILTNRTADGRIRLRSLSFTEEGVFRVVGTRLLKYYHIDITQLLLEKNTEGEVVLYADYRDGYNHMHTEGVVFRDGGKMFDAFHPTVISKQWEYTQDLNCADIDGDWIVETPSVIHEQHTDELDVLKTVEWTDYARQEPVRKYIGIYDTQEALFVAIPDSWQNNIYTRYSTDGWQVFRKTEEGEEEQLLFTVTQVEYRNDIETGAYSYLVYKDTKTWHLSFEKEVELSEIQHILKSVTDLG